MNELSPRFQTTMNLSFAGCGFLGMYHVGVASCFREYAPQVFLDKISGASAGALAAVALLCDVPLGESTSDILKMVVKARKNALGPFHPGFDVTRSVKDGLEKMLPPDAYIRCTGRMHVSVTRVSDGENVLLTNFNSNEELITVISYGEPHDISVFYKALLCSCFVPFYSGFMPLKFQGVAYIDGGFSDNLPILDENTVTVSPFSGESDICPQDNYFNFMQINLCNTSIAISPNNLYRFTRILFPSPPEVLSKMCQQGFDDALKFLQRNNLISCTRCLAVQSSFVLSPVEPSLEMEEPLELTNNESINTEETDEEVDLELEHTWDDCKDCRQRLQVAVGESIPDAVAVAIQDACDQLNKGLVNWIFSYRPIKFLYFMTVPYVLPFDFTVAMLRRVLQLVPKVKNEMQNSLWNLINFAKNLVNKFDTNRHLYSAKFSCQLAITEYNYSEEKKLVSYSQRVPVSAQQFVSQDYRSKSLEDLYEKKQIQRRSYAGHAATERIPGSPNPRRKSLVEPREPERVISTMNFGFTVGLSSTIGSSKNKRQNVMEAFKTLGDENTELNAIDMANKALNWERECLERCSAGGKIEQPHSSESFETILDVTNRHEALMAFYFMDNENRVKVTEIFNVTDADTSAILSRDERQINEGLQWDSNDDWNNRLDQDESFLQSSLDVPDINKTNSLLDEEMSCDSQFESSNEDETSLETTNLVSVSEKEFRKSLEDFREAPLKRKDSFAIAYQ